MLLVGPEAKQCTGKRRANSARAMVPSFRVRYSGACRPVRRSAPSRAAIVLAASSCRQAFSAAAFSRPSNPMRPSSCDRVTWTPGTSSRRIRSASSSQSGTNGEKTALTATEAMPASAMRRAASRTASRSIGTIGRPSHSWPPRTMCTWPRTASARSAGQSTKGGRLAPVGSPMRSTATFCRPRRWTTALVNCVVPTTTASAEQRLRRRLHQVRERRLDAGKHVLGGRRLHRCEYAGPLDQRGIRVGAADIDPDAAHAGPSLKIGR